MTSKFRICLGIELRMRTYFPPTFFKICFVRLESGCGLKMVGMKYSFFSFNVGRRINRGTQYRHGVYYHNDAQKKVAEKVIKAYGEDCVTECLPAAKFYVAEEYHQQYLLKGGQSARKGEDSTIRCYG
jgi:Peptide methionine sulfoxide reductase